MGTRPNIPTSYADASAYLGRKDSRPVANNTRLERRDPETIAVRLHATDVVTFHADGRITLDTGGWRTVTTKDRMNASLPDGYRVYSDRGTWSLFRNGETVAGYADGMTISADGAITGQAPLDQAKQNRALSAKARAYARAYMLALSEGTVAAPSAGDCWYCLMRSQTGQTLGETIRDDDHITSHIAERYFVPSLLVRAAERYGASMVARDYMARAFAGQTPGDQWPDDIAKDQLEKSLYRYVKSQLGIAS